METDTSNFDPKEKSVELEEIKFKPSSALIPDEYEVNNKLLFHIFNCCKLDISDKLSLAICNELTQNNCIDTVQELKEEIDQLLTNLDEKSGLFFVFINYVKFEGSIFFNGDKENHDFKHIWTRLTASKCPELKDKPKILLFLTLQAYQGVQTDGKLTSKDPFQSPDDSDLLIILKKFDYSDKLINFVDEFSSVINTHKKKFDIIDLINLTKVQHDHHTTFISTLTRKFYLAESKDGREDHLSINEINKNLDDKMAKVFDFIRDLHEEKEKQKSIEDKADEKRKTDRKDEIDNRIRKTGVASRRSSKVSASDNVSKQRKKSNSTTKPPWKNY